MFFWGIASKFPSVIVTAATIANRSAHWSSIAGNTASIKRIKTMKPAAFDAVEMNAVMGVGAP